MGPGMEGANVLLSALQKVKGGFSGILSWLQISSSVVGWTIRPPKVSVQVYGKVTEKGPFLFKLKIK